MSFFKSLNQFGNLFKFLIRTPWNMPNEEVILLLQYDSILFIIYILLFQHCTSWKRYLSVTRKVLRFILLRNSTLHIAVIGIKSKDFSAQSTFSDLNNLFRQTIVIMKFLVIRKPWTNVLQCVDENINEEWRWIAKVISRHGG